jgi:DNA-binding IscR family transcriptional regulator
MRRDSKLSSILHVLLHMAQIDRALTSEELAHYLGTNPAQVRRTLAGLRECGFVCSEKGHGGGWILACDLRTVTLRDIYEAVGSPTVFAMGNRTDNPACAVERAVNDALGEAFREAEALLIARFDGITLADLSDRFGHHLANPACRKDAHEHHAPTK